MTHHFAVAKVAINFTVPLSFYVLGGWIRGWTKLSRDDNVIDVEFAKVAIDDFFLKYPHRGIRFQGGGEPTLRLNAMRDILDYSRNKWGDVNVELQTHGAFDNETFKWIKGNVNIVWISHDGFLMSKISTVQMHKEEKPI